ncbi:polyprenyl diphosphate synthase [Streptomyces resistomycificus]|uniref:Isoprenyl transferase n=1 Tax=Streptomyces resistomycificus TaxID=67356 RepID=A0A0L8LGF2_9ACTN|nr:polyprenyl diphosphate synthase [Streptomyces resistomycificus]KOG37207.1 long-chain Z-isoprenyl diphosphate synthase [Streptomyces resistomycificus]KUN95165.1 long-chain Z-isoprenyl diphosphate synthase [Streptomyces resistomycificus]
MRKQPQPTAAPLDTATHARRRGRAGTRALMGEDPVLRAAYQMCRRTTRQHDPGIYALVQLVPAVLRPACWALWAAASVLDDLADERGAAPAERAAHVEAWTRALKHDLAVGRSTDPIRYALLDTAGRWSLDLTSLQGAMAQTRDDAHGLRFPDWAAWRAWCNKGVVPWVDQVRHLFEQAGAPMTLRLDRQADYRHFVDGSQLTDTLTDLSTDLADGHLLLPREALEPFPDAEADLAQGRWSPAVAALIAELTALARRQVTRPGMTRGMHPGPATVLDTAADLMRAQLDAIDAAGPTLLTRPPRPSVMARTRVLGPARLRSALAWSLTPLTVPGPRPSATEAGNPGPAADDTGLRPPPPHPDGIRPPQIAAHHMPCHVAVIMDGNGRWAEQRGLPRHEGHRAGAAAAHEMVYGALEIGLPHLTLYTLSTENWKRGTEEITMILEAVQRELDEGPLRDLDVRQRWSGRPDKLPEDLVHALRREEHRTRNRTGLTLTVCINYGGRDEIARTAAALAQAARDGEVDPHLLGEDDFARHLPHPDMPDVDLLWRTGNEQRTSNFLPWHATYAELYFTPGYWPDNDRRDLWDAITEYSGRQRRHGAVPAPLA